jgi:hypothetical protein
MLTEQCCYQRKGQAPWARLVPEARWHQKHAGTLIQSSALKRSAQSPTTRGEGEGKKPKLDELEYEEAPSSETEKPHNVSASEDEDAGSDRGGQVCSPKW